MLNVANLKPEHFERILSGAKRTEWRWRRKPDARLEAVKDGELIALLETGSDRMISATVRRCIRFDYRDGCCYAVRLANVQLGRAPGIRKVQGWHRRPAL